MTPETPLGPVFVVDRTPSGDHQTARKTRQEFRIILRWLTAKKCSKDKGCLSPRYPRDRVRPVSPPASYYPNFRLLHIQVKFIDHPVPCCPAICTDDGSKHLFISKLWDRMTVPHCPLVSERSDDWPRRRLAKNRGTPCSRDCLTGAVRKHCESNTWK